MFKIFDEKIIIEKVTEGELIRPSLSCFVLIQSGSIELEVNGVRATSKSSDLILFSPMKMYKLIHRSQNLRAYFILYKQEALKEGINVSFNKFSVIQLMNMEQSKASYSLSKEAFSHFWNTAKQLDLPATWVAQLSLAPLLNLVREQNAIVTPSKFPQVRRDIAILVNSDISLQTLESTIRAAAGEMLTDLWLFDIYQGDKVPTGQRSLAFALIWQDRTQTLSDDAVKAATDKVVSALTDQHAAQLRDS